MKKFVYFITLLVLAGCSSKEVKEKSTSSGGSSPDVVEETVSSKKTVETKSEGDPVRPQLALSSSQYASLNEAIKSQNDERIYKETTQILAQSPHDIRALNALAMYHFKKGRFDLTQYLLNKAISHKSDVAEVHSNLGLVYLAKKEQRQAIQSFKRALQINANDGIASANLGSIYIAEKDYQKAAIVLETAYRRGVRDPKTLNNYGVALAATGKFDRAEEMYKAVLANDPNQRETLFNYATLLIDNMNKGSQGLEVLNRLKFVGGLEDSRNKINALENKAKAGIK